MDSLALGAISRVHIFFLSKYMFLEGAFVCQVKITQNRVLQQILVERNDFLNLKALPSNTPLRFKAV